MPKNEFEPDDPMELVSVEAPANEDTLHAMARCFVEEFVCMGYPDSLILNAFKSPFHTATHMVYRIKGEEFVSELIEQARAQWGQFVFVPTTPPIAHQLHSCADGHSPTARAQGEAELNSKTRSATSNDECDHEYYDSCANNGGE